MYGHAAILKNAIFVMFGHFFETVTRSNIFADIKIYQIRSRNLICLIWRRKIIFSLAKDYMEHFVYQLVGLMQCHVVCNCREFWIYA